ncbi:unnamed protein product [Prorocentrum cordatum]|uniref:Uncharacterized protein n=1 Tax=Prorocentrum cordatum TaxID=2364126 RepID=A0ABN9UXA2_9DINO|nr:unnamed protein product [Polarella glacialis]
MSPCGVPARGRRAPAEHCQKAWHHMTSADEARCAPPWSGGAHELRRTAIGFDGATSGWVLPLAFRQDLYYDKRTDSTQFTCDFSHTLEEELRYGTELNTSTTRDEISRPNEHTDSIDEFIPVDIHDAINQAIAIQRFPGGRTESPTEPNTLHKEHDDLARGNHMVSSLSLFVAAYVVTFTLLTPTPSNATVRHFTS